MNYFSLEDVVDELTSDALEMLEIDRHRYSSYLSAAVIIKAWLQDEKEKSLSPNSDRLVMYVDDRPILHPDDHDL